MGDGVDERSLASRYRALLIAIVVTAGGMLVYQYGPAPLQVVEVIDGLRDAGPLGQIGYLCGYALGTWLMLPGSWVQGSAGFLYGPVAGFFVAWFASTGFGAVSFWLARGALREPLERRLSKDPRLNALDKAVGDGGVGLVVLLRLSPISPYNVVNYALGLTRVTFRDYLIGTALGGLSPVILYSYMGAQVSDLARLFAGEERGPGWLQWTGLGITLVVTVGVTLFARRALQKALAEADRGGRSAEGDPEARPEATPEAAPEGAV